MVEQDFTKLLRDYPDQIADKKRFSGLVKDMLPGQPMQINLLMALFEMGIHTEIAGVSSITNAFAYRFVKQLMDERGVSRSNADWAVSVWCVCYGKNILGKSCEISTNVGKPGREPVIRKEKSNKKLYEELFAYKKSSDKKSYVATGFTGDNQQTIIIPNRYANAPVTEIGDNAFKDSAVQEAIITEGIAVIGKSAFYNCTNLKRVVLPESLIEIKDSAFACCPALTALTLPSKLGWIGYNVFDGTAADFTIICRRGSYAEEYAQRNEMMIKIT